MLDHLRPACAGPIFTFCDVAPLSASRLPLLPLFYFRRCRPLCRYPIPCHKHRLGHPGDPARLGTYFDRRCLFVARILWFASSSKVSLTCVRDHIKNPRTKMGPIMAPHAPDTRPTRQTPCLSPDIDSRHSIQVSRISLFASRSRPTFAAPPAPRENSGWRARGAQHRHSLSRLPGPTAMPPNDAVSSPCILLAARLSFMHVRDAG